MLAGVSPRLSNYSIYPVPYLVRLRTHFFRLVESGRNPSQVSQNIGAVSAGKLSSAPIWEQSRKSIGILQINRRGEPLLFVSDARERLIYLSGNQRLTV